jgi:hypothetical protein
VADVDYEFPAWTEPATKGDVISGVVAMRALSLRLWQAFTAFERGDAKAMRSALDEFDTDWDKSIEVIRRIGAHPMADETDG